LTILGIQPTAILQQIPQFQPLQGTLVGNHVVHNHITNETYEVRLLLFNGCFFPFFFFLFKKFFLRKGGCIYEKILYYFYNKVGVVGKR